MEREHINTRKYIEACWRSVFWTQLCRDRYDRKLIRLYAGKDRPDGLPLHKMIRLCIYGQILMIPDLVIYLIDKKGTKRCR